jgi:predicted transcriptional regulator
MVKVLPKTKNSSKVNHIYSLDYYVIGPIWDTSGLTWREICQRIGLDYDNNGNKRMKKMTNRLEGVVYRRREGRSYRYYPHPNLTWMTVHEVKKLFRESGKGAFIQTGYSKNDYSTEELWAQEYEGNG